MCDRNSARPPPIAVSRSMLTIARAAGLPAEQLAAVEAGTIAGATWLGSEPGRAALAALAVALFLSPPETRTARVEGRRHADLAAVMGEFLRAIGQLRGPDLIASGAALCVEIARSGLDGRAVPEVEILVDGRAAGPLVQMSGRVLLRGLGRAVLGGMGRDVGAC